MIKKGFSKKVALWQKGGKGASHAAIWRRRYLGRSHTEWKARRVVYPKDSDTGNNDSVCDGYWWVDGCRSCKAAGFKKEWEEMDWRSWVWITLEEFYKGEQRIGVTDESQKRTFFSFFKGRRNYQYLYAHGNYPVERKLWCGKGMIAEVLFLNRTEGMRSSASVEGLIITGNKTDFIGTQACG